MRGHRKGRKKEKETSNCKVFETQAKKKVYKSTKKSLRSLEDFGKSATVTT